MLPSFFFSEFKALLFWNRVRVPDPWSPGHRRCGRDVPGGLQAHGRLLRRDDRGIPADVLGQRRDPALLARRGALQGADEQARGARPAESNALEYLEQLPECS